MAESSWMRLVLLVAVTVLLADASEFTFVNRNDTITTARRALLADMFTAIDGDKVMCTMKPEPRQIFYNRIASASPALKVWIDKQKRVTKFLTSEGSKSQDALTIGGEMEYVQILVGQKKSNHWFESQRCVYTNPVSFIDFERYKEHQPAYINMMHDPVDRYISQYHNWRSLRDIGPVIRPIGVDLLKCLAPHSHQQLGCPPPNYQTRYLCGHGPPCVDPPDEATFRRALFNLQHKYAAVALQERWQDSVTALTRMFPGYFSSAMQGDGPPSVNKSPEHSDQELRRKVAAYNGWDVLLYRAADWLLSRRLEVCV